MQTGSSVARPLPAGPLLFLRSRSVSSVSKRDQARSPFETSGADAREFARFYGVYTSAPAILRLETSLSVWTVSDARSRVFFQTFFQRVVMPFIVGIIFSAQTATDGRRDEPSRARFLSLCGYRNDAASSPANGAPPLSFVSPLNAFPIGANFS